MSLRYSSGIILLTIVGNAIFSGNMREMSQKYDIQLSPSNWTFSIWGLIYSSLFVTTLITKNNWNTTNNVLLTISSILNVAWLYFWNKDEIKISSLILFCLSISLWGLLYNFKPDKNYKKQSIAIYSAWATVASLINFAIVAKYKYNYNDSLISNSLMTLLILISLLYNNFVKSDIGVPLTFTYASIGILSNIKNNNLLKINILNFIIFNNIYIVTYL